MSPLGLTATDKRREPQRASGLPKGLATFSAPVVTTGGCDCLDTHTYGQPECRCRLVDIEPDGTDHGCEYGVVYTASANLPMTVALTPPTLTVSAAFDGLVRGAREDSDVRM